MSIKNEIKKFLEANDTELDFFDSIFELLDKEEGEAADQAVVTLFEYQPEIMKYPKLALSCSLSDLVSFPTALPSITADTIASRAVAVPPT